MQGHDRQTLCWEWDQATSPQHSYSPPCWTAQSCLLRSPWLEKFSLSWSWSPPRCALQLNWKNAVKLFWPPCRRLLVRRSRYCGDSISHCFGKSYLGNCIVSYCWINNVNHCIDKRCSLLSHVPNLFKMRLTPICPRPPIPTIPTRLPPPRHPQWLKGEYIVIPRWWFL